MDSYKIDDIIRVYNDYYQIDSFKISVDPNERYAECYRFLSRDKLDIIPEYVNLYEFTTDTINAVHPIIVSNKELESHFNKIEQIRLTYNIAMELDHISNWFNSTNTLLSLDKLEIIETNVIKIKGTLASKMLEDE